MYLYMEYKCVRVIRDFPDESVVKNPLANAGNIGLIPGLKISWKRKWHPTPVFLPGESQVRKSQGHTVHGVAKELDTTEQLNNNIKSHVYITDKITFVYSI